jgi:hypothetical protein
MRHVCNAFCIGARIVLSALGLSLLSHTRLVDDARTIIRISRSQGDRHYLNGRFDGYRSSETS